MASAGCCFAAVSRYVRGLVRMGLLETDLMAAFQARYSNRGWPILARALQAPDPVAALLLLQRETPPPGPLAPHVQRYLELHQATGKDYQPNHSLLTHLDRFLEAQGIGSAEAITPEVLERWAVTLTGNARTRFLKVRMAWRFFNHLRDLKVVSSNPTSSMLLALGRRPRSSFQPFIFTREQVAAILDAARQLPSNPQFPLRAETCSLIFALLYGLGLRMGEACRLRVRDLSLAVATLFIDQTKFYKSHYVPFGPKLGSRLQQFVELRRSRQPSLGDDDPLFVALGPGHVDQSGLNNTFRTIVDRLGIRGLPEQKAPRPHVAENAKEALAVERRRRRHDLIPVEMELHTVTLCRVLPGLNPSFVAWCHNLPKGCWQVRDTEDGLFLDVTGWFIAAEAALKRDRDLDAALPGKKPEAPTARWDTDTR